MPPAMLSKLARSWSAAAACWASAEASRAATSSIPSACLAASSRARTVSSARVMATVRLSLGAMSLILSDHSLEIDQHDQPVAGVGHRPDEPLPGLGHHLRRRAVLGG